MAEWPWRWLGESPRLFGGFLRSLSGFLQSVPQFPGESFQFLRESFRYLSECVQSSLLRLSWLVGDSGGPGNTALLGFGQHERGEPFNYAFFAEGFYELWVVCYKLC